MAYLQVAGITVSIGRGGQSRQTRLSIGARSRAFAGNLRSSVRATKREWSFQTNPLTVATYDTLVAAIGVVTVAGDAIGSTITADVEITDATDIEDDADALTFKRVATLQIREV